MKNLYSKLLLTTVLAVGTRVYSNNGTNNIAVEKAAEKPAAVTPVTQAAVSVTEKPVTEKQTEMPKLEAAPKEVAIEKEVAKTAQPEKEKVTEKTADQSKEAKEAKETKEAVKPEAQVEKETKKASAALNEKEEMPALEPADLNNHNKLAISSDEFEGLGDLEEELDIALEEI